MSNKVFAGVRYPGRVSVTVGTPNNMRPLSPRLDLRNHSPDGFEWGYGGSGPAQLALAIAAEVFGEKTALAIYQELKRELIEPLQADRWQLTIDQVVDVATPIIQERAGYEQPKL